LHELDRIEQALASKPLNHNLFERCGQDLLIEIYPGLSPIPGGTDWGRDADVHPGEEAPPRLLVTSSRSLEGVRQNMNKGIASMTKHGVPFNRIVLANCAQLSQTDRSSLNTSARKRGAIIEAVYDRTFFASRLRRDGEWRSKLLGLSADPVTLSRTPDDLAQSPWRELPLVGREREVEELSAAEGDLVVSGPPGVGKTRVLAGVTEAYFVDHDAEPGRLADDLRWLDPKILVVDDAGAAEQLIRRLVRFRIVEADIANYRIIVVCWPDEVDRVSQSLGSHQKLQLDLLERSDTDQLLLSMGITGQFARTQILDQAEGRLGWAISISDMLLRAPDITSLRNGQALFGQVQGYFLRAGVPHEAADLLATVAACGEVAEPELGDVASELNMSRPQVVRLLAGAATSGLIDVLSRYDFAQRRGIRHYVVRPPMLADALVAERAFKADVPGIDLRALAERWPGKLFAIAESVIDSALLGAPGARTDAEYFYELSAGAPDLPTGAGAHLSERFAQLDRQAANVVLGNIQAAFIEWRAETSAEPPWRIQPIIELAYLLAQGYHLPQEAKDELWRQFGDAVYLIGEYLVGDDIDWLEHALDEGLFAADKALSTYNSFGPHPTIEQFARVLVPRGVDPRHVAGLAQLGSWSGDESARYGELIERFEILAASGHDGVASVGRAGIDIYTVKRDEALAAERRSRVRGEL
jgi:hypothetical protein